MNVPQEFRPYVRECPCCGGTGYTSDPLMVSGKVVLEDGPARLCPSCGGYGWIGYPPDAFYRSDIADEYMEWAKRQTPKVDLEWVQTHNADVERARQAVKG